jgi:hypothetical protein
MLSQGGLVVVGEIRRHRRIMRRNRSEGESAPMTLGQALAAKVRLIVWCKACGHQAEPRYGGVTVIRLGGAPAVHSLRRSRGRFRGQRGEAR